MTFQRCLASIVVPCLLAAALPAAAQSLARRSAAPPPPQQANTRSQATPIARTTAPNPSLELPAHSIDSGARAPASAKRAGPAAPRTPSEAALDVFVQHGGDGALWARGANWKLRFADGAATYVPFLCSSAPQNYPLELGLRAVSVGGRELSLEAGSASECAPRSISVERGCVREVYELAQRSIEQKFVFERLPGAGELVLRIDARTELTASALDGGFAFANEFGAVHYGAATAIDADGRELALDGALEGEGLTLRVPAAFLETARLPLVIDPLIATFGVETSPSASLSPDVSFDASGQYVLHTYESVYSAGDHDVWTEVMDRSGVIMAFTGLWVDYSWLHWVRPRVAHLGVGDKFLIAAEVGQPGAREVWGLVRDTWLTSYSATFLVSGAAFGDNLNVDVGGDPYPIAPSYFLVTYEQVWGANDHDILAQLIDTAGNLYGGVIVVDGSIGTLDELASVSKSDGESVWNIAWQREAAPGDHDILAARVSWSGTLAALPFALSATAGVDEANPSASSSLTGLDRWCVAHEYNPPVWGQSDILLQFVDAASYLGWLNMSGLELGGAYEGQDQRWPSIDSDGRHFACAYSELWYSSATDYDVFVTEVGIGGYWVALRDAHTTVAYTGAIEIEAQIAAAHSSNSYATGSDYALDWGARGSIWSGTDDVIGAWYAGNPGGEVTGFCYVTAADCPCGNGMTANGGCGNSFTPGGAALDWSGAPSVVADTLTFLVSRVPPGQTALVYQGTAQLNYGYGFPFADGRRCVGGNVVRFVPRAADAAGNLSYPQPGDPSIAANGGVPLIGGYFYYQVWYRDPTSYCTPATSNLSNALSVLWTP